MPVLSLSPQQVIGSRCTTGVPHDWMGYKSPNQMAVGRALDSWHLVIVGFSLVFDTRWFWIGRWCLNRDWFWIIVVVCLYYQLTDFTVHLLFLFTTLIFTTCFPIINKIGR